MMCTNRAGFDCLPSFRCATMRPERANFGEGVPVRDRSSYRSNLNGADLREADLRGANLTGALLAEAKLIGAVYDAQTRWSQGFDAQQHGAVRSNYDRPARH